MLAEPPPKSSIPPPLPNMDIDVEDPPGPAIAPKGDPIPHQTQRINILWAKIVFRYNSCETSPTTCTQNSLNESDESSERFRK
jgi:hypothetical protein